MSARRKAAPAPAMRATIMRVVLSLLLELEGLRSFRRDCLRGVAALLVRPFILECVIGIRTLLISYFATVSLCGGAMRCCFGFGWTER